MNFQKYILILLTLVLLSVGCTSTNFAKISTNEYLPKSESVVLPVFSGDSDQMYERIGVVFVYGGDTLTKEQINDSLRDQAGKVGADAIIFAILRYLFLNCFISFIHYFFLLNLILIFLRIFIYFYFLNLCFCFNFT